MNIIDKKLQFRESLEPLNLENIENIMIHHTAHPTWTINEVHNYHKNSNGWLGIGYNYFVEKDGTVEQGRGLNVGAGATGYNKNSIHICFAGNFQEQTPTEEQIKSGKEIVQYVLSILPNKVRIIGHRDIGNTSCPGKNFPLEEFKKLEAKKMTEEENKKLIQEKTGLQDSTMTFLSNYLYHEQLFEKLANAMKK